MSLRHALSLLLVMAAVAPNLSAQSQEQIYCEHAQTVIPVLRNDNGSPMAALGKFMNPGPAQDKPWFVNKGPLFCTPVGAQGASPANYVVGGVVSQRDKSAENGRYIEVGEKVWIMQRTCPTSAAARLRDLPGYYLTLTLQTDRALELVEYGRSYSRPFLCTVKISMPEAVGLSEEKYFEYLAGIVGPQLPRKASGKVRLGQSPNEVEEILGQPTNVVDLGERKIFLYPNLKVIFSGNRVTDVQ